MTVRSPVSTGETSDPLVVAPPWTWIQKLCFRFLFTIGVGMLIAVGGGSAVKDSVGRHPLEPMIWLVAQIGSYLTRGRGIEIAKSAGSDLLWFWCLHLGWVVLALMITAVWTVMDRGRSDYRGLSASLIVFARLGLALVMISYGLAKVIPVQMGFMTLPHHQLKLTGDTSLFETLWGFMGASAAYSVAAGLVELVSGLLLLWNRTQLLGALGSAMAMGQVLLLNMTYDVPVKLAVSELLLVAIGIASPYWPNLARVVFNHGETRPVVPSLPLGAGKRWLRRTGVVAKFGIAGSLLVFSAMWDAMLFTAYNTPTSTLDGVWRATSFTVDGREAALNQTSPQPWTNVAIAERTKMPQYGVVVKFVSQVPGGYTTTWRLRVDGDWLKLRKPESDSAEVVLRATQPDKDRLVLAGQLDGRQIKGTFERRFMQRGKFICRLVSPVIPVGSVQ
ncbi:hypothetical protein [Mycobacterium sp. E1747]|uniref:hypothetical protein n=1 Tax=Mycobacterium sp. E1747 TaxID=1834128 RepID=UPI0008024927|nr:hypothetical protein A5695_16850 [Mycobacterium sp. E1747]